MKLLLDVNVVLDVLLGREPWYREASRLLSKVEEGGARGFLAGHSVTTIYYVVAANRDRPTARRAVEDLLGLVDVVAVGTDELHGALDLDLDEYENAVQATCASTIAADSIVTRNLNDFVDVRIPAELPGAVLARL